MTPRTGALQSLSIDKLVNLDRQVDNNTLVLAYVAWMEERNKRKEERKKGGFSCKIFTTANVTTDIELKGGGVD